MRSIRYVLAAPLAVGAGMRTTRATASAPPPALLYEAPQSCPSREEFVRRTQARLRESFSSDAGPRRLEVVLARKGASYEGRFTLVEPGGRSTTKTLDAPDCDGLIDALSLVAALALEPIAQAEPDEDRPPSGPAPSAPSPSAPSAPTAPPIIPPPPPAPRTAPVLADQKNANPTTPGNTAPRLGLELGGRVGIGVSPGVMVGGSVGVDWSGLAVGPLDMAFGLAISGNVTPNVHAVGGTASFTWVTVHPTACPFGLSLGPALALRACATGDFGLLIASGQDTISPATSARQWAALGGSCRLEVLPRARLPVHVEAGIEAPLRRDRYAFGANDFFEVPSAVGTGSVSLAFYFR